MEKSNPNKEHGGIFKKGKAPVSVFRKEVNKYRPGGLAAPERKALAEDMPSEHGVVYEKKVESYAKKLKPVDLGLDDKSDPERKAGIRKAKDRLDELMGKQ